ncbi:hypothetical protein G6514_007662 [Epicoccum nigrum]|nr:hypothetical protein G6514_007662 [Epicoccum nigrum]
MTAEDIDYSADAPTKPKGSETSAEWDKYRDQMERLTAAVKRAMNMPESEEDSIARDAKKSDEDQSINISLNGSQQYRLPWSACRTWPRMETFLREWFREDKVTLKAIDEGNFIIQDEFSRAISPGLWESVGRPVWDVEFSFHQPPDAPPPPPVHQNADTEGLSETCYENRVQYKVSYFQRDEYGGHAGFVSESVFKEPIALEVAEEHERLPAIEEMKTIQFPADVTGRNRKPSTRSKLRKSDTVSEPTLKIHSPYLLNVLKSIIEYSAEQPTGDNQGLDAGMFLYPYMDLYLHLEELLEYKTGDSELRRKHSEAYNKYADDHIDLLQSYLMSQSAVQYNEAKARSSGSIPLTTFGTLWLLMKPGTDVYVRETDGSVNRYVLDKLMGGTGKDPKGENVTVNYMAQVWNLVLDEKAIRQFVRQVDIPVFDDERAITELPIFPVRYIDDCDDGETRQNLIQRGQKYFAYSKKPCFLQYDGHGLKPGSRFYKRARVVVEHASRPWMDGTAWGSDLEHHMPAHQVPGSVIPVRPTFSNPFGLHHPPPPPPPPPPVGGVPTVGGSVRLARCECKDCKALASSQETYARLKFSEYREIIPVRQTELSEHQYSILPSHMFAFILNDRAYDLLDVAKLEWPSMADTAIDRLVMPSGNKELIKAIARTYTDKSQLFKADFIYGKGEGQIILLHGPPGTGKTLTAESVAEFTGRPLLNITAADLGHEPELLEKSLLQYFRRANDWDAIVLLDEADVYLEKRSKNDLQRNSIVSVFLRALDYFQGILFLTTNRINQFDEAFKSRIHLSLGYDKLNDAARAQIWGNLFQKLKDDHKHGGPQIGYDYDAKQYVTKSDEVKVLEWNGREIRNAFQTAVALAVYDSKHKSKEGGEPAVPEVTEDHLRQVVLMSSAFRKYMKAANNDMDDSDLAFREGNRDDRVMSGLER